MQVYTIQCRMESKDVTHIITSCCYSIQCYKDVCNWIDTIMPQSKAFQVVHYISIWSIWPMCNFSQFEGRLPPPFQVSSHIIVTAQFYYSQGNPSKPQIIGELTMDKTFTWAFFDGSCQRDDNISYWRHPIPAETTLFSFNC